MKELYKEHGVSIPVFVALIASWAASLVGVDLPVTSEIIGIIALGAAKVTHFVFSRLEKATGVDFPGV